MDQQEWLAHQFEEQRPHLRAVAYRMLGSLSEADDAVQDAWLRLSRADTREVENLRAWLTTIVARVALNMLRARRTRREQPLDVFGLPFEEIAPIVERSPEATRQLASRARRRVRGAPVPDADLTAQWQVVDAFLAAVRDGDFDAL